MTASHVEVSQYSFGYLLILSGGQKAEDVANDPGKFCYQSPEKPQELWKCLEPQNI